MSKEIKGSTQSEELQTQAERAAHVLRLLFRFTHWTHTPLSICADQRLWLGKGRRSGQHRMILMIHFSVHTFSSTSLSPYRASQNNRSNTLGWMGETDSFQSQVFGT